MHKRLGADAAKEWDFETTACTGSAVSVRLEIAEIRLVFADFEPHTTSNRFSLMRGRSGARETPKPDCG